MDILILGNGFDLAHGLKTRYADFLLMCKVINDTEDNKRLAYSLYKDYSNSLDIVDFNELKSIVKDNFWIKNYIKREQSIGEKWLDFEEEMKYVMDSIVYDMKRYTDDLIHDISNQNVRDFCYKMKLTNKPYKDLFVELKQEHKSLIRALEIHMGNYINKQEVNPIKFFQDKRYYEIINYNYTDTYERTYDQDAVICHIHGKASVINGNSDMVLGFDDHYLSNKDVVPELIPFEKYYQRIVNKNNSTYFKCLDQMKTSKDNHVDIFGHSLAVSDGDVIKQFILQPNTTTTIIYYDELDRAEKIRNLAIILGPDELIKMTSNNPVIEFIDVG